MGAELEWVTRKYVSKSSDSRSKYLATDYSKCRFKKIREEIMSRLGPTSGLDWYSFSLRSHVVSTQGLFYTCLLLVDRHVGCTSQVFYNDQVGGETE